MSKEMKVIAQVTGNVWKIAASVGQRVAEGDVLLIVESMKMEIPVESPCAGTLRELHCVEGGAVQEGEDVATLEIT